MKLKCLVGLLSDAYLPYLCPFLSIIVTVLASIAPAACIEMPLLKYLPKKRVYSCLIKKCIAHIATCEDAKFAGEERLEAKKLKSLCSLLIYGMCK